MCFWCFFSKLPFSRAYLRWLPSSDIEVELIGDVTRDKSEAGGDVLRHANNPRLTIDDGNPAIGIDESVRVLEDADFDAWDRVSRAMMAEEGVPWTPETAAQLASFTRRVATGDWWGCFEDGRLLGTAGLDAAGATEAARQVAQLRADGRGVAIITHDMDFALSTCTRCVILGDGGILADGPTRELMRDGALLARAGLEPPALLPAIEWLERQAAC